MAPGPKEKDIWITVADRYRNGETVQKIAYDLHVSRARIYQKMKGRLSYRRGMKKRQREGML